MPISCESCREALHSHLADFIATKIGEVPVLAPASAPESAPKQEGAVLSSTRRSEIEAHLAQCADCARELALLRGVTAELHVLPAVPAPRDLRARIQAQIASEVQAAAQPVAATQPVSLREQANRKANSAVSWFGLWRDFWCRPARVAWAGAALTGILLLLATQANLPLPTSQSDSATAPESGHLRRCSRSAAAATNDCS
jgi:anti-sigma factor RsiW